MSSKHLLGRLASLVVLALMSLPATAAVTVILVRHAEKAAQPANDPPLTLEGKRRAELLAATLADAGVTAIYVTEYRRTGETAAVVAERLHLAPQVIPGADTAAQVAAIRQLQNGTVLVVGHSNTVPKLITLLGGPAVAIDDNQFDGFFVLTLGANPVSFLRLHYGEPPSKSAAPHNAPPQPMLEKR